MAIKKRSIKKCRGIGKAIDFGCGDVKEIWVYGLCFDCRNKWLMSDKGITYIQKHIVRSKRLERVKEKEKRKIEKEEVQRKGELQKILQKIINEIVRIIDIDKPCISCGHGKEIWTRRRDAGHFYAVGGNYNSLRYNMHIIHCQCIQCNVFLHSNNKNYIDGLIKRYGIDYYNMIESLPQKYKELHLTKEDLKEAIKQARFVKKELLSGKDFTRDEINKIIRIYK